MTTPTPRKAVYPYAEEREQVRLAWNRMCRALPDSVPADPEAVVDYVLARATTPGDRDRGRELAEIDAQLLGLALDFAWSSWIGDVGHVPDAFDLNPRTAECRAAFEGSAFVSLAARRYAVLAAPAETEAGDVEQYPGEDRDRLFFLLCGVVGTELRRHDYAWSASTCACGGRTDDDTTEDDHPAVEVAAAVTEGLQQRRADVLRALAAPAETEAGGLPALYWSPTAGLITGAINDQWSSIDGDDPDALPADARRLTFAASPPAPEGEAEDRIGLESAEMYRDLARRAICQALAPVKQAEGAGETAGGER